MICVTRIPADASNDTIRSCVQRNDLNSLHRESQTTNPETSSAVRVQSLVDRWRRADKSAADELYGLYEDAVRSVVRFHLNRRFFVRCDEDDAVQTIFLQVFRRLAEGFDEFESESSLRRWVRAVARNRTIKLIRHQMAGRRDLQREQRGVDSDAFQHLVDMHSRARREKGPANRLTDLQDRLTTLDEESREIIQMLGASLTQQEIAQRMKCTTRTVRRRVHRIRETLLRAA